MWGRTTVSRATVCLASSVIASGPSIALDGKDFFKGKTATWYVGTGPGGGHDFYARLLARSFPKALPGLTVVVANRPGAGHIVCVNIIYASKPDGLAWGSFTTGLVYSQIQKTQGIKFDLTKMSWIGKAGSDVRTVAVGMKSEYKTFQDLIDSKRPVKFSASGIGGLAYLDSFLTAKAFSIPQKIIFGYNGAASALGLMRGETDVLQGSAESALEYVRAGQARLILQFGDKIEGVPNGVPLAKTPLQKALVAMMDESGKLARITAGPPGIPPDRLELLRRAYDQTVADPEVIALAAKASREINAATGEEVHKSVLKIMNQPPEILALLKQSENADAEERKVTLVKSSGPVTKVDGSEVSFSHGGQEVAVRVTGSRTEVSIGGSKADRKSLKVGMTCTFEYDALETAAKSIVCD